MDKLIAFITSLGMKKFTGDIRIKFNQGGVISVKSVKETNIEI